MNLSDQLLAVSDTIRKQYPFESSLVLHAATKEEQTGSTHWVVLAKKALEKEIREGIIGEQAAAKINSFLWRHIRE